MSKVYGRLPALSRAGSHLPDSHASKPGVAMDLTSSFSDLHDLPDQPRIRVPPPGPETRALAQRLQGVESQNVTYLGQQFPVFWRRAHRAMVEDADGNVYLDLTGAFGVAVAGHTHPRITAAIREQAGVLPHGMGDIHPPVKKVELLEALAALLPWKEDSRITLANSGSEAVEIALKTALLATGQPEVVAFQGGYHGLTVGSLAATAREDFRDPFRPRIYPGVSFVPFGQAPMDEALQALERTLAERGGQVGAVIVEPIQGRAGVRVPAEGFLTRVAELTREAGALLIFDEIFTGFGRTGRCFALEAEGVVPDLICVGKALGGGLPLSACAGPRHVMDAWPRSGGEALHTSTFLGHPLACASALAFLEVLEEEGLADYARREGAVFQAELTRELSAIQGVREVRGRGFFLGVELEEAGAGVAVMAAALRRGVLVLPAGDRGEVVELSPPLVLSAEQQMTARQILVKAIQEVCRPAADPGVRP
jgi:4-aminobutyrate aminotransferase-like enzyme